MLFASRAIRLLPIALSAGFVDSFVDLSLEFITGEISKSFAGFLNRFVKNAPADGFLDEFGDVALLHALRAKVGAQGEVSLPRPSNGKASGIGVGDGGLGHIRACTAISLSAESWFVKRNKDRRRARLKGNSSFGRRARAGEEER